MGRRRGAIVQIRGRRRQGSPSGGGGRVLPERNAFDGRVRRADNRGRHGRRAVFLAAVQPPRVPRRRRKRRVLLRDGVMLLLLLLRFGHHHRHHRRRDRCCCCCWGGSAAFHVALRAVRSVLLPPPRLLLLLVVIVVAVIACCCCCFLHNGELIVAQDTTRGCCRIGIRSVARVGDADASNIQIVACVGGGSHATVSIPPGLLLLVSWEQHMPVLYVPKRVVFVEVLMWLVVLIRLLLLLLLWRERSFLEGKQVGRHDSVFVVGLALHPLSFGLGFCRGPLGHRLLFSREEVRLIHRLLFNPSGHPSH